jgi:hypothetical protein
MTPYKITNSVAAKQYEGMQAAGKKNETVHSFKSELEATIALKNPKPAQPEVQRLKFPPQLAFVSKKITIPTQPNSTNAYQLASSEPKCLSGWEKYKEDQLLSNPGGDRYDLCQNKILNISEEPTSFLGRIGKDFSDGIANISNGVKNLFMGTQRAYRDDDGQIKTVKKGGVFRAIGGLLKNIGSALTFGQWHPDEEKAPKGFIERAKFTLSKLKNAVMGDLLQGVAGSTLQIGEDLVLAGWNLAEIIPDATIGNFDVGKKLTTAIFDNGQVAVDYLTDIMPTGEAWLRVHALNIKDRKLPILYNLSLQEHYKGDARWQTVRNTPFRKTIETIGSLLADIAAVKFISNSHETSQGQKKETGY